MFETKKELREKIESLEAQLRWQIKIKDKYCHESSELREKVRDLESQNAIMNLQLNRKCAECACGCCRHKPDDRMTLGEFEDEMEKIAVKYDLHFNFYYETNKRTYRFTNHRIDKCSLSLHMHPHCGWAKIVIDINNFAVCKSELRNIENSIIENCLRYVGGQ